MPLPTQLFTVILSITSLQPSYSSLFVSPSTMWTLPSSLSDGAHTVKAFIELGPNLYPYDHHGNRDHGHRDHCNRDHDIHPHTYNSTLHDAPLQFLDLNPTDCPQLLSGTIMSRTFTNTTVLVSLEDFHNVCGYSHYRSHPTLLYLALAEAGASAIIAVTSYNVPGVVSKLVSPYTSHRRARDLAPPFAAIGRQAGNDLQARLLSNPDDPVHVEFFFDENRYQVSPPALSDSN